MPSKEQYSELSLSQKAETVRENGLLLESKEVEGIFMQLYQLEDYYVVVKIETGFKLVSAEAHRDVPEDWRKNY